MGNPDPISENTEVKQESAQAEASDVIVEPDHDTESAQTEVKQEPVSENPTALLEQLLTEAAVESNGGKISGIFFGHGVADMKKQKFTVAILPVATNVVNVGIAVCSAKDVFVKRVGRMMAEGRARKRPVLELYDPSFDTTTVEGMLYIKKHVKELIASDICAIKDKIRHTGSPRTCKVEFDQNKGPLSDISL